MERYAMLMEKPKHKITMRRRFTYLKGNCACRHTALTVLSSLLRREKHFLDDDLARINSTTAQTSYSIHVPPLPRTPARGSCTHASKLGALFFVFLSYSGARILHAPVVLLSVCKKRVHASKLGALFFLFFPHFVHALSHCSQRSCKRCVVDNSLGCAQVIGTSSIATAMKRDTSRDCRRVGKSSVGM